SGISTADGMLFVANTNDPSVSAFLFDKDGKLNELKTSPIAVNNGGGDIFAVFGLELGSKDAVAYVGDPNSNDIFGFRASKRQKVQIREVGSSPDQTDLDDSSGGLALTDKLVYALDGGGSDVQAFHRNSGNELERLGDPQNSGVDSIAVGE